MRSRVMVDRAIVDALMPDLVGHDHHPSAFLVYLYLWCRAPRRRERRATVSLQQIAIETGLSKSAAQQALRRLKRRRLVTSRRPSATSIPDYVVHSPWSR
ncbi:MAG: helix-turn-helix domain-containing protein [Vicinamibacterales bacterium]